MDRALWFLMCSSLRNRIIQPERLQVQLLSARRYSASCRSLRSPCLAAALAHGGQLVALPADLVPALVADLGPRSSKRFANFLRLDRQRQHPRGVPARLSRTGLGNRSRRKDAQHDNNLYQEIIESTRIAMAATRYDRSSPQLQDLNDYTPAIVVECQCSELLKILQTRSDLRFLHLCVGKGCYDVRQGRIVVDASNFVWVSTT